MRYFAGKSKIGPRLARAILNHTFRRLEYFEPFVGGGAILELMSRHFVTSYASDTHRDLILMWQAVMNGWVPPSEVSKEEHGWYRHQQSSALRGFIGFGTSFGGKWFGAYATFVRADGSLQNFAQDSQRSLQRCYDVFRNTTFHRHSYEKTPYTSKSVIYCDPPYAGTYSYSSFDTPKFWKWAEDAALDGAHVYVSEFKAPEGWVPIWQHERPVTMRLDLLKRNPKDRRVMESLYVHHTQQAQHLNTGTVG